MAVKDDLIAQLDNEGVDAVAEQNDNGNPEDQDLTIDEGVVMDVKEETKEKRSELVCEEDIKKVLDFDKVALQKYAHSRLGKELDLSKRIKMLKTEVVLLIQKKLDLPTDTNSSMVDKKEAPVSKEAEFMFNPKNRRIFEATELLLKRTDLIPCWIIDEEGKRL
jgi:hypothetical protein